MKPNKFYVIVKTGIEPKFTLLSVDKMETIKGNIPSNEEIYKHTLIQYQLVKEGKEFQPIQLKVSNEAFELIKKEIRRKINSRLILEVSVIDIVIDMETLPVIQIVRHG